MEELSPIQFAIQTPQEDDEGHIRNALALGIPEADSSRKTLWLYANGPSAKGAPLHAHQADTMAVNGALALFGPHGPDFWVACDPQPLVAGFLKNAPQSTTYMLASKCHPAVFEALQGRDVRLWHVNDNPIPNVRTIPPAVSVTLMALMLAMRLGYRTIHVWGWDCCYDGETHHSGPGELSNTATRLHIEVDTTPEPTTFESNATWACEVEDAKKILPVLKWAGVEVRIHGRSMVGAILHEYAANG